MHASGGRRRRRPATCWSAAPPSTSSAASPTGIRSGGDVDFCWRLQRAGWTLEQRPEARVEHHHREDLASFLAMVARYGAGSRWLNERHPGAAPRWPLVAGLVGSAGDVARATLLARPARAGRLPRRSTASG